MASDSSQSVGRRSYRFGLFTADCRKRLLWSGGIVVPLTPKAFEILATLIDARGRVIEKDELVSRVWGSVAVEDATLARHISTLRRALDERPDQHSYIVTVPGRGYEFVAPVTEVDPLPAAELDLDYVPAPAPAETVPAGASGPVAVPAIPSAARGDDTGRSRDGARWLPFAMASVFALVVVGGVFVALEFRRGQPRTAQRALQQFTFHGGLQRQAAWSPDGGSVAYTSDAAGSSDIWVQPLNGAAPVRVTSSPAEDSQPDWSPDGQSLVFRSERDGGGLYVAPVAGGNERRIVDFGYRPKWSPDGSLVLFSSSGHLGGSSRIYLVGRDGGSPRLVRPDLIGTLNVVDAGWAPDRSGIAIWARRKETGEWIFATVPVEQGAVVPFARNAAVDRRIQDGRLTLGRFVWSPSGRDLFFEGLSDNVRNIWRVTVDPATHAWIGGPDRLTTDAGQDADIAISPDGTRLIFSAASSRTRVWTFPFDGLLGRIQGPGEAVTAGGGAEQDADSPADASKLVYSAVRGNREELWVRSMVDGRERLLLSSTGWKRSRPRWSRDGLNLAYLRSRTDAKGGHTEQSVAVLTVGGEERLVTRPGQIYMIPSDWSPDGAWLLGGCPAGTPLRVSACVLPLPERAPEGATLRVVASDPAKNLFEARFSPDQRWISFIGVDAADARVSRIYLVPVSGGEWRPITEGLWYDDKPHWSRDGRTLYFVSDRQGMLNVWGLRFDPATGKPAGEPFKVTSFASPRQTISAELGRMQIAVTATQLFLPVTETSGELWLLDNVDR
jgi:Tol biopolymer transport system component/DNA-binding winged helix-turn-helix (wHTH) protein